MKFVILMRDDKSVDFENFKANFVSVLFPFCLRLFPENRICVQNCLPDFSPF